MFIDYSPNILTFQVNLFAYMHGLVKGPYASNDSDWSFFAARVLILGAKRKFLESERKLYIIKVTSFRLAQRDHVNYSFASSHSDS